MRAGHEWTWLQSKKMAPNANTLEKPSNMGPNRFPLGFSADGIDNLGDSILGDETSGQISEGDKVKQDRDSLKSDCLIVKRNYCLLN
jgi:hypothetical protein